MNEELAIILETASKIFNKHVNHDLRQFIDKENINLINNKLNEATKKRDRWVMGVGVGYGVSLVNGSTLSLSPWIGASLLWTPKWLQFGK